MHTRSLASWVASLVLCIGLSTRTGYASAEPTDRIRIVVNGLRTTMGEVRCLLFDSEDGFPSQVNKAFKRGRSRAESTATIIEFNGVPTGIYAVACFHDENNNGKLETNLFGIPREPWAISNDARPRGFGPPGYARARFDHEQTVTVHAINLNH